MNNIDCHGREVNYIRVSVTSRCNLRCAYCFPTEGILRPQNRDILTIKQIHRLIRIFSSTGIRKVRLTGGEPLIRKGITTLIRGIKELDGIEEVTLTTNGVLLEKMIPQLKESGLDRINISLDSLKPSRFKEITSYDVFHKVTGAIETIMHENIWTLKLNVVAIKGVNDDEILDFADFASQNRVEVRFIELMPSAYNKFWSDKTAIPGEEVKETIEKKYTLVPVRAVRKSTGPAKVYKIDGGLGRLGFVCAISQHFCDNCNRLRLTAEGKLRSCLFSDDEIDLRPGFINNEDDAWFLEKLAESLSGKPKGHTIGETANHLGKRPMTTIGG